MLQHRAEPQRTPARVVVLGATGFVGGDIVRHLRERELEVVALSSADVDLSVPESVKVLEGLLRPEDAVVIVSALTPDRGRDAGTLMKNWAMGRHLSEYVSRARCAHLIYISSDAVYADEPSLIMEATATSPSTFHGLMHLGRERMLAQAAAAAGSPWLALRPCSMYGPRDTHNAYGPNRFLRSALAEGVIKLIGQGEERRDHVFIDDLCRLIGLCLQRGSEGVLNVATGRSVSFAEVARQVASLCGAPVRIEPSPRQSPVTHRHLDATSTWQAFPAFRYTPLAEGLARMVRALGSSPAAQAAGLVSA